MNGSSTMHYGRKARGLLLLPLLLWLTACASSQPVPLVINPVKCEHPSISPYDHAGLVDAVRLYHRTVETCNALNGYDSEPERVPE